MKLELQETPNWGYTTAYLALSRCLADILDVPLSYSLAQDLSSELWVLLVIKATE